MQYPDLGVFVNQSLQSSTDRFQTALNIGLDHQIKFFHFVGIDLINNFFQGEGAGLAWLGALGLADVSGHGAGLPFVGGGIKEVTCLG